eukprot:gene3539-3808_t
MERPTLVMTWLHELLLQRQAAGGLTMPAPILARVYQACEPMSLQHYQKQSLAVEGKDGPFSTAQFVLVMLVIFTLTLPFLVLAYVSNIPLAVVLTESDCSSSSSLFAKVITVTRQIRGQQ